MGGKACYIYSYSLSRLSPSAKVRFVYVLKGRQGEQGIVRRLKGSFLANGCFMIPEKSEKEISDVFRLWGVRPKKMRIMLIN